MNVNTHRSVSDNYSRRRRVLVTVGTLVATVAAEVIVGPVSVLIAVGVGTVHYLVSTTAAFAIGQIVLAALYPSGGALVFLVLAEIGLFGVLFSTTVEHHDPKRLLVASLVAGVVIGGIGWVAFRSDSAIWIAASAISAGTALVAYGLHRYEQVLLGLVEPT